MQKENDLESWRILFRVADAGSITRVAEELGVETSSVSRRLSALQKSMQCDLLQRTPHALVLSPNGLSLAAQLRPLLTQWDSAIKRATQHTESGAGKIRVSAAIGSGQELMTPLIIEFQRLFPEIFIDLVLTDRPADLSRDDFDLVFRYGPIEDDSLIARRTWSVDFIACASPQYLDKHGPPTVPSDLSRHATLIYSGSRRPQTTHLHCGTKIAKIECKQPLGLNNVLAIREAAIAGAGIALDIPLHSCAEALRRGQLVRVLPEWAPPPQHSYAVRVPARHPPRRVSLFLDWITEERRKLRQRLLAEFSGSS